MTYDDELLKIVKGKQFKTFWHCVDYLLLAGYPPLEAFGVSLKEFGYTKIFTNVAFVRYTSNSENGNQVMVLGNGNHVIAGLDPYEGVDRFIHFRSEFVVGLIDDTNIHLDGLYTVYRTWLMTERYTKPQAEIEDTCDIINVRGLTPFIIDYLKNTSIEHFGIDVVKEMNRSFNRPTQPPEPRAYTSAELRHMQEQVLRRVE